MLGQGVVRLPASEADPLRRGLRLQVATVMVADAQLDLFGVHQLAFQVAKLDP